MRVISHPIPVSPTHTQRVEIIQATHTRGLGSWGHVRILPTAKCVFVREKQKHKPRKHTLFFFGKQAKTTIVLRLRNLALGLFLQASRMLQSALS